MATILAIAVSTSRPLSVQSDTELAVREAKTCKLSGFSSRIEPNSGSSLEMAALGKLASGEELQVGCALRNGGFRIEYQGNAASKIEISSDDAALIFFFLKLMSSLQAVGTVAALDFDEYGKVL